MVAKQKSIRYGCICRPSCTTATATDGNGFKQSGVWETWISHLARGNPHSFEPKTRHAVCKVVIAVARASRHRSRSPTGSDHCQYLQGEACPFCKKKDPSCSPVIAICFFACRSAFARATTLAQQPARDGPRLPCPATARFLVAVLYHFNGC